ncbi:MAG TPA: hypothetical protein PKD99_01085 [Sphingopyxis sp.]|nr:hypothetical protein [Sphingopyxis sp.]HMP43669.1 hypothetical protein [Sphingopyxis sp.]HMQ19483.1 hypothetical protein [Sphingopyxis sp.]
MRLAAMIAALAIPAAATAQVPPDAAKLKAIEAKVPPQDWYPDGYYDIRIAAEAQIAERPRARRELVSDWGDGIGKRYDVIDCGAEWINPEGDLSLARYGNVALDVSRLRSELQTVGYPLAVYAAPLADYERWQVAEAERLSDHEVMVAAGLLPPEDVEPPEDAPEEPAFEDSPEYKLAEAIEANRRRLAPKLPKAVVEGGCGAGDGVPVILRTAPAGGEILLVNAFAFKVCTRKTPDPWDRFACKWNEIETGVERRLSGRYVYQVKWPDGTVRKGTREIAPNYEEDALVTVTFRKTGS